MVMEILRRSLLRAGRKAFRKKQLLSINFNDIELLWEGGDSKPGRDGGAVASAWFDTIVFALDVSVCDIVCEMIATATSTAFFLFESKVLTNRCW